MMMAETVAERRGAKLVRDGASVTCKCPFACMATYEACEFSRAEWDAARPQPKKRWWRR